MIDGVGRSVEPNALQSRHSACGDPAGPNRGRGEISGGAACCSISIGGGKRANECRGGIVTQLWDWVITYL